MTGFGISGVKNLGLIARGFISYFIQAYQEGVLNSNLILHNAGVRLTFGVHVSPMRVSVPQNNPLCLSDPFRMIITPSTTVSSLQNNSRCLINSLRIITTPCTSVSSLEKTRIL